MAVVESGAGGDENRESDRRKHRRSRIPVPPPDGGAASGFRQQDRDALHAQVGWQREDVKGALHGDLDAFSVPRDYPSTNRCVSLLQAGRPTSAKGDQLRVWQGGDRLAVHLP